MNLWHSALAKSLLSKICHLSITNNFVFLGTKRSRSISEAFFVSARLPEWNKKLALLKVVFQTFLAKTCDIFVAETFFCYIKTIWLKARFNDVYDFSSKQFWWPTMSWKCIVTNCRWFSCQRFDTHHSKLAKLQVLEF